MERYEYHQWVLGTGCALPGSLCAGGWRWRGGVAAAAERLGETNPQTVPLAVSVLDGESLRKSEVVDWAGVGRRTPGLTVTSFNVGQPYI